MYLILPNPCNHGHGIVKCGTGICRPEQITSPIKNYMILPTGAHRIYRRDLTFFAQNFKAWSLNLEQVHYNAGDKTNKSRNWHEPIFFSPLWPFLIEGVLGSKNLFSISCLELLKTRGRYTFPDPVGHFGAPWWPFWIFEVLIEGMIKSKNLFSESCSGSPLT